MQTILTIDVCSHDSPSAFLHETVKQLLSTWNCMQALQYSMVFKTSVLIASIITTRLGINLVACIELSSLFSELIHSASHMKPSSESGM